MFSRIHYEREKLFSKYYFISIGSDAQRQTFNYFDKNNKRDPIGLSTKESEVRERTKKRPRNNIVIKQTKTSDDVKFILKTE
jgi:hypothetical protein